jgi:hypothetical protein
MAVVSGTFFSAHVLDEFGGSISPLMAAEVLFTVSGTYAQADNGILAGVPTLIQNSIRNGKTVNMKAVAPSHPATRQANPALMLGLKTVAISTNDVTFEITTTATEGTVDMSTEFDDATAVPAQDRPFAIIVFYTES